MVEPLILTSLMSIAISNLILNPDRFVICPNAKGKAGDGLTAASINFKFSIVLSFRTQAGPFIMATGPAVNLYPFDNVTGVRMTSTWSSDFGIRTDS